MKNEVGIRLRQLRLREQVGVRELARRIGHTASYVSKMEEGGLYPAREYLKKVVNALRLSKGESENLGLLLTLFEVEHDPLANFAEALSKRQGAIERLEASATRFRSLQTVTIPGLLQTPQFAAEVFAREGFSAGQVRAAVRARVRRQRILSRPHKEFVFLMTEAALRTRIAPTPILREQVLKLVELSQASRPNVRLGFLPFRIQWPTIPPTSFQIQDETIVTVDTLSGMMTFRNPEEIEQYLKTFQRFEDCALTGDLMEQELLQLAQSLADSE